MALRGSESADIDAPLDTVWAVVEDVLIAHEWQGGVISMTALESDGEGRATLVKVDNKLAGRIVSSCARFSYEEAPTRLSWRQEKGDLKAVEGSWTLEDLGGGRTRATYSIDVDPGRVLGMLVRPVEGAVVGMLIKARPGELKAKVEGA